MIEIILQAGLVPVVIGLISAMKTAGLPARVAPLVSIVLGVFGVVMLLSLPVEQEVLQGIIVGLAASGLYSGAKAQLINQKADSL